MAYPQRLRDLAYERRRLLRVAAQRFRAALEPGPRVGYVGGQASGNLGDDLMFRALQTLLPGRRLVSYAYPDQERRLAKMGLSGPGFLESVVLGGGTLISDPAAMWRSQVEHALDQGLRVVAVGTGVGSSGYSMGPAPGFGTWIPALSRLQGVGVRGPMSESDLRAAGIPAARAIGDLALALAIDQPDLPGRAPSAAVNVALPHGQLEQAPAWLDAVTAAVTHLRSDGWRIVPIAMARADERPLHQVLTQAGCAAARVRRVRSWEEFRHLVGPCRFMLAVRLHAAVLATALGVPAGLLGYRNKCLDFMRSIALEHWHMPIDDATTGNVHALVHELARATVSARCDVLARAQSWRARLETFVGENFR